MGERTKCPACRSDVPWGADVCPNCYANPYELRAEKQKGNRKIDLMLMVVLVAALVAYQLAVPMIKDLSRTEAQRSVDMDRPVHVAEVQRSKLPHRRQTFCPTPIM
jgi:hypothetical protein